MILQLNPPIPVFIVGKGKGYAQALIDNGPEHHLQWTVFMDETGECWTVENPQIRAQNNITLGRISHDKSSRTKR